VNVKFRNRNRWQRAFSGVFLSAGVIFCGAGAVLASEILEVSDVSSTAESGTENLRESIEEAARQEEPEIVLSGEKDTFEQYRVLIDLIDSVSRNYVDSMTREELIRAAIEGVTSRLDPYSYYISSEKTEDFRREVTSSFGGVGMAVDERGGKTIVVVPLPGMPAYEAGIHAGDELLEIDGVSLEGKKLDEVLDLLSGEIGSEVKLKVRRQGNRKPMEMSLEREMIFLETVLGFDRNADDSWNWWLDERNGIAYLQITEFRDETANEMRKVLESLQKPAREGGESPLRGLILDLRFNPGGNFNTAIEMCDMFITDGVIVSAKGKNTVEEVWRAGPDAAVPKDMPIAILLNSYSASASEVFSACLQDHHRAVIVGERSFGKGVIQSVLPFEGGQSNLKLTTAGYYSPNGRNIHRNEGDGEDKVWGVSPEEKDLIQTSVEEDQAFMADRSRRSALRTHNDLPVTRNPAAYRDIQLEHALGVVGKTLNVSENAEHTLERRSAPYREEGQAAGGNASARRIRRR